MAQHLNVAAEVKLDIFINGLNERLKNSLKLRQPRNFDDAVTYARLKDSTKISNETNMEKFLETLKMNNSVSTDKEESSTVAKLHHEIKSLRQEVKQEKVAAAHTYPTKATREIARLKEENRLLKGTKTLMREEGSNLLEETYEHRQEK